MDFPGNSHKATEGSPKAAPKAAPPEKKIEKIVTGEVKMNKKPLGSRLKSLFFRGEAKEAAGYVTGAVLLPAMKAMAWDAISRGSERLIFGDTSPNRRVGSAIEVGRPRVSYNTPVDRAYQTPAAMLPKQPPHRAPQRREASQVTLELRADAESVVEQLADLLDVYQVATVADLNTMIGMPHTYVDNKWGWTTLDGVDIIQTPHGYMINLPPMEAI